MKLVEQAGDSITKVLPEVKEMYVHLHENPELSMQEKETCTFIAGKLKELGIEFLQVSAAQVLSELSATVTVRRLCFVPIWMHCP